VGVKASDILGFDDLRTKVVKVKEWKRELTIRELGLDEGMRMVAMVRDVDGEDPTIGGRDVAQVVAWGVVDDDGERVFSDDDVDVLVRKSSSALMFLYREIIKLSNQEAVKN